MSLSGASMAGRAHAFAARARRSGAARAPHAEPSSRPPCSRTRPRGEGQPWRDEVRAPAKTGQKNIRILVDADACPVKEEIYRVAFRLAVPVTLVTNSPICACRIIRSSGALTVGSGGSTRRTTGSRSDAGADAVVVTADILLADRCLKAEAAVIAPNGRPFTGNSIGAAIATRAIMADLRAGGDAIGGPPPFAKA